jgi:hypothetical protein
MVESAGWVGLALGLVWAAGEGALLAAWLTVVTFLG